MPQQNNSVQFIFFKHRWLYLVALIVATMFFSKLIFALPVTPVQLAEVYKNQNIQEYLVSEKYDGIRAIWKNNELRTRNGNLIHAPRWFTQNLPNMWLDGELWFKRGEFEFVASTVSKKVPSDEQWQHIKYMVFDAPDETSPFKQRAHVYTSRLAQLNIAHVQAVKQFTVDNHETLMTLLTDYTNKGAEGLMLQQTNALFSDGRTSHLLKLKTYMDAEATVLKHLPGKGKYQNMLGALLVQYIDDSGRAVNFKIGTGFSDHQRANPPAIGDTITFSYHGFTKRGIPRFASFIRIRDTLSDKPLLPSANTSLH